MINCTFSGNQTDESGGGMYSLDSDLVLTNVTFSENSARVGGGGLFNQNSSATVSNAVFWGDATADLYDSESEEELAGGGGTVTDSLMQDGSPPSLTCNNVMTINPVLSGLQDNGGYTKTRALGPGSSAIDFSVAMSIHPIGPRLIQNCSTSRVLPANATRGLGRTCSRIVVSADLIVPPDTTLNLDPGVELRFDPGVSLIVQGTLVAAGAPDNPVIFTSNQSTPAKGDWERSISLILARMPSLSRGAIISAAA